MKKVFLLLAVFSFQFVSVFNSYAQSVPAAKLSQNEIMQALQPLFQTLQPIESEDSVAMLCVDFVRKNQNDAGVYVVTQILPQVMSTDSVFAFVEGIEYYRTNDKIAAQKAIWKKQQATSEGRKFVDFSAEYNGKVSKLSDYVGKGKYVLVDFWASWCGPCKAEIPNLIAVYNKYQGDKFTVLGVATWDKPEATLQAMNTLGINYPQIMNAQKAGSDAYGINGIPQIILFGPDGTILKRNLRGEAIEKTVAEYLK